MRRVPRAVGRPAVNLPGPFPLAHPACWTNPPGRRLDCRLRRRRLDCRLRRRREIAAPRPQRAGG
jgi:hypothetical protein